MNHTFSRYADWKAPDEDGQLLLWPDPSTLLRQTTENRRSLSNSKALIQNVPLSELRQRQRHWVGHTQDDQPLIATGHQTELYHPGVWVKDALTNALARKLGGRPWHFAVDTDAPKHLHLRWPGGSMPITDDERLNTAAWSGLLHSPTPAHVGEIEVALQEARDSWDFEPMAGGFLASLKLLALQHLPLPAGLTGAVQQLDLSLGLRQQALLLSPVWTCEPYLVFVHHLLARPGPFAAEYNTALAGYRKEQGITSQGRPMPDLEVGPDEIETAFWLDDLDGDSRRRLMVRRVEGGWALSISKGRAPQSGRLNGLSDEDAFVFRGSTPGYDAAARLLEYLRQHHLRIAPRALPLTMFFRMFLADQYVHGIGGGRYDQVTDCIIAGHFGIDPPRFSVTTATLYFPAARGQKRVSLRPLLQEGRRLRHGSFWREKRNLADRIATLPRRSRERSALFSEMHANLARQASSDTLREWSVRLDHATREQMRQKAVFDRELFFGIQPEDRLRELISRYDAATDV